MIKIKNLKGYLDNEEILSSDNANLYINSPAIIIQTKDDSTKYKGKMSWKVILNNTINDSRDILESKQILIKMVDINNKEYSGYAFCADLKGCGKLDGF